MPNKACNISLDLHSKQGDKKKNNRVGEENMCLWLFNTPQMPLFFKLDLQKKKTLHFFLQKTDLGKKEKEIASL